MEGKLWNLVPGVSISGINFGGDRTLIREMLGNPVTIFRKTGTSVNTTDAYPSFHVFYSDRDKLEAIEFFGNDINLSINSQLVFPGKLSTAKEIMPDLEEHFGTYISRTCSVGICVEDDIIISILVGRKEYYQ